jgi:hypothetical protein
VSRARHQIEAVGAPFGALTVEGPVLAEVLVLVLDDGIRITGPCGPAPWLIEVNDDDPTLVVARMVRSNVGEPIVVHSTSWRRDRGGVVLTFVAVMPTAAVSDLESAPLGRADLARGGATSAPAEIDWQQVAEHGLRHLAWLVRDDVVVAENLGSEWAAALVGYVPEPFRSLESFG